MVPAYQKQEFLVDLPYPAARPARGGLHRRARAALVGGIMLAFGLGLGLTFLAAEVEARGYQVSEMKKEIAALEVTRDRLRLEVAALQSPERLERIAVDELGMVRPGTRDVALLPDEGYRVSLARAGTEGQPVPTLQAAAPRRNPLLAAVADALAGLWRPTRVHASEL